ncbi:MAG TPA: GNAT family N-acetyltransferase [Solirubrobacteraceae bacterium]|nr:GNAT family N-acetyltransferase [Solirubrobacteraceae bacterium]
MIPEVETERLRLRAFGPADIEPFAAMMADPVVAEHVGGVQAPEDAWRTLAMFAGGWSLSGFGVWAVERREDGAFLGRCGLWKPEGWPVTEVGWTLARSAWGHGYATEAGRAALDWGFAHLDVGVIGALIVRENTPSARVAERLGMVRGRETVVRGVTCDMWETTAARRRAGG